MRICQRTFNFIFLFSVAFTENSISQDSSKWVIGIHGGAAAAAFYDVPATNNDYQLTPGFIAGVVGQYEIGGKISICAEVNFEMKGNSIIVHSSNPYVYSPRNIKIRTNLDYITLPLTCRYTHSSRKLKYYIQLGPYIGYLLSVRNYVGQAGETLSPTGEVDMGYYRQIDYGLTAGIGLAIPLSKKFQLPIEIRNNLSIHRLYSAEASSDNSSKNESFALVVGLQYLFQPTKKAGSNLSRP